MKYSNNTTLPIFAHGNKLNTLMGNGPSSLLSYQGRRGHMNAAVVAS